MKETLQQRQADADPFGLRNTDFRTRIPERSEMFDFTEAMTYIHGCDFAESADDLLLSWELMERFGADFITRAHILDAMSGPGRLGRELLGLGAQAVTFHDGHDVMLAHSIARATEHSDAERIGVMHSPVTGLASEDNVFDLVVCHNSTHQLETADRLTQAISEFVRVTKPGGWVVVADFQRNWTDDFISALEKRLMWTRPDIIPLLVPTFLAAFTKEEFDTSVGSVAGVKQWAVIDAALPSLDDAMRTRVEQDPVKGHVLDFSPISCRVIIQKEEI